MDKKTRSVICHLQETHRRLKDTHRLKVKGRTKTFHANGKEKKAGVAVLMSDKIYFKTKFIVRDKEGHYIMIKGTVQQDGRILVKIYAPDTEAINMWSKFWWTQRERLKEIQS